MVEVWLENIILCCRGNGVYLDYREGGLGGSRGDLGIDQLDKKLGCQKVDP